MAATQHSVQNQSVNRGLPGQIVHPAQMGTRSITRRLGGATKKVSTVTLSGTDTTFGFDIVSPAGVRKTISVTDAGGNTTANAAAIAAKLEEDLLFASFAEVSAAAAVLTFTALREDESFTIDTAADANMGAESVTTAAGSPADLPFGLVAVGTAGNEEGECELPSVADGVVLGIAAYDPTQMVGDDGKALYRGEDRPNVTIFEGGNSIYARFEAAQEPARGDTLYYRYAGSGQRGELRTANVPGETATFSGWEVKGAWFDFTIAGQTLRLAPVGRA